MSAYRLMPETNCSELCASVEWPAEVDLIMSAMEAARPVPDRRQASRVRHRVRAELRLFSDLTTMPPRVLFTRDCTVRGIGFICPTPLPLGYGGKVELESPDGQTIRAHCTIYRCRQTAQGWYEGMLSFNTVQPTFA